MIFHSFTRFCILPALAAAFILMPLEHASAQSTQSGPYFLTWDLVAVDGIAGMTTNRLYLNCVHPDDFLTSVSGWSGFASWIETTTSFYQNENGWVTPNANVEPLFDIFEGLEYDSWITIGIDVAPVGSDLEMGAGTFPPSPDVWVVPFEEGGDLIMDADGAWYITLGSSNGIAGEDLQILVGQFTTDGTITGSLNFQIFTEGIPADTLMEDLYTVEIPPRSPEALDVPNQSQHLAWTDWSLRLAPQAGGDCQFWGWSFGPWSAQVWSADGRLLHEAEGHGRSARLPLGAASGVVLVRFVADGQVRVARLVRGG